MKHTSLNEGKLGTLLKGYLARHGSTLKKLKKIDSIQKKQQAVMLFPVEADFEAIKKGLCGFCGRKVRVMRNGNIYCNRKKCPAVPKFFMTKEGLKKLSTVRACNI